MAKPLIVNEPVAVKGAWLDPDTIRVWAEKEADGTVGMVGEITMWDTTKLSQRGPKAERSKEGKGNEEQGTKGADDGAVTKESKTENEEPQAQASEGDNAVMEKRVNTP